MFEFFLWPSLTRACDALANLGSWLSWGGRATGAGQTHCRLGAGALHSPAHLRCAELDYAPIAADHCGRMSMDALETDCAKACGHGGGDAGLDGLGAVDF